ncbi:MAG: HxsD-like protein [Deltaproteobacteria bacterium]
MTELRLHRELYAGTAVDAAVKMYSRFAAFELLEEASHWVVRVTAKSPARETQVARELANYALGTTIRERGAAQ